MWQWKKDCARCGTPMVLFAYTASTYTMWCRECRYHDHALPAPTRD